MIFGQDSIRPKNILQNGFNLTRFRLIGVRPEKPAKR